MNPWKKLTGVASWLIRLSLILVIYTRTFGIFMQLDFADTDFYIAAGFILAAVLLLVGGFFKQGLTVVAGLLILILSAIQITIAFDGITPTLSIWALTGSAGLFFLSYGNK